MEHTKPHAKHLLCLKQMPDVSPGIPSACRTVAELDLDGYAVGGLAVGETHEEMYYILEETVPYLPVDKPTYLMGVGTPANILEGVERGIDFFDSLISSIIVL